MKGKSRFWVFIFALLVAGAAFTQNRDVIGYENIPGKHQGAVTAMLRDGNGKILSAGEDGFLEIWNLRTAEERFQVSRYAIKFMAARPGKTEVAVVETDGFSLNSVSAWNYETKKRLFTLHFRDSVSGINYSAAGSFLIVSRSGLGLTIFLDPQTGEILESPGLPPSITMASTGRSERNMVFYQPSGTLSYWNLETKNETQRFNVPSNIQNPVLFGNSRFMAGIDSNGFLVLDAVTGSLLARDSTIRQGSVFTENTDSARFYCLSGYGQSYTIFHMEINLYGVLSIISRRNLSIGEINCGVSAGGDNIILGTRQGDLWLVSGTETRVLQTQNQEGILDMAVSSSSIALVSENGTIVHLPLDYSALENGSSIMAETIGGNQVYSGISSSPLPGESRFLLWESGRSTPMVISSAGPPVMLDKFSTRYPIRSAAMLGGNILFLNTTGVVSVLDRGSGETIFSYSSAGSVDAAFVNNETIIIGRNAAAGSTPFMTVSIRTGETVPLAYPGILGVKVYRGGSGAIYGAVINQTAGNTRTSIVALNLSNPARSETIVEFDGEDPFIAMAESGGNFATTLGNGMAALYPNRQGRPGQTVNEVLFFEGGKGFPIKIIDGGRCFIVLDGEGAVSWHDNQTGRLLAAFRLYPDFWLMEKTDPRGQNMEILRGGITNAPPRP